MAQVIQAIYGSYRDLMDNKSDPRVNDWILMSSPFPTLSICLFYVYFVKILGPKLMENRKPFDLRRVMMYYNLFQVIFSSWLFYEVSRTMNISERDSLKDSILFFLPILQAWLIWGGKYSFRCQPVDYTNNPSALRVAKDCWWYYFSKFIEFTDTIFFILRKKNDHVNTLHIIHHGVMPMSTWFGVKFTPGEHMLFFIPRLYSIDWYRLT